MKKKLLALTAGISLALSAQAGTKLSFDRELSMDSSRVKGLEVDAGSGHLEIVGADVDVITVKAEIKSEKYSDMEDFKEAFEDDMVFELKRNNGLALLKAKNQDKMFSNPEISIHLTVTVPQSFDLIVDDGSGHITIEDIDGSVEIDDGSGHIELTNINNDVEIDDGSGGIKAYNITGNVTLDDGSGGINMNQVSGDVEIEDGSGEINLKNLGGHVDIEDGSGEISAKHIAGDFKVDDGSGSILIADLEGEFKLVDDGSGFIKVNGKKWAKK